MSPTAADPFWGDLQPVPEMIEHLFGKR